MSFFEPFMCPVQMHTGLVGVPGIIIVPPAVSVVADASIVGHRFRRRLRLKRSTLMLLKSYLETKQSG